MTHTLIGYARCSTDKQDLAAQQDALVKLGVAANRIYTDKGFTGTNRTRPGLDQALAAVRSGDTLVVPKLDRLARSVPDARAIGDDLAMRGVKLQLGASVHDPSDPMGKLFFNILHPFVTDEWCHSALSLWGVPKCYRPISRLTLQAVQNQSGRSGRGRSGHKGSHDCRSTA
ncbi:recombinase family protein [Sphingomonas sp. 3F27F9]|uniref:recombinase family protein n=1 Tax=Sphingomonas sp. 3F27F9 TaxID=2502209 RepID=UPI0020163ADC|nr:recombinase family protein [Sphingomonas sp. 3F27F9]